MKIYWELYKDFSKLNKKSERKEVNRVDLSNILITPQIRSHLAPLQLW